MRLAIELNTASRSLAAVLLVTSMLACAGDGPKEAAEPAPAGASVLAGADKVSSIKVSPGDTIASENRGQFDKYTAAERLQTRLTSVLQTSEQFDEAGALTLNVVVTDFRLRSGALAFWVGAMAGADYYNVRVEALKDGEVVKTFETNTSTILGGIAYASPTQRSERMINTLAERIHTGL